MGNSLAPVPGSQPMPPNASTNKAGLVLNFYGSNFTGSNEGVSPNSPTQSPAASPSAPSQQTGTVPYWPNQSLYPTAPSPSASAVQLSNPRGMTPSEQLNALYNQYNAARQKQDDALKAVQDAEQARNNYLGLGQAIRNASNPTPASLPANTLLAANPNLARMAQGGMPLAQTIQPDTGSNTGINPAALAALNNNGNNPVNGVQVPMAQLPEAAQQQVLPANLNGLTPQQALLAAQALKQSGLSPADQSSAQPSPLPPSPAPAQGLAPATDSLQGNPSLPQAASVAEATPAAPAAPQALPPAVTPSVSPNASNGVTPPTTAGAEPASVSGAPAPVLNNLIFTNEELAQFKKLNAREKIDWITQRNLQTKADAIGEIAIQSGLPTGNVFTPETYDRLETIAQLDTKDIKGPAGDDLRYFRKTALWTLGLLNGSQNANTPVDKLPAIKTVEAIARDPKETKDIRVAAAQALQAMNRGNDPTMQQTLKRIKSNNIGLIKPWTWLRARTPQEVNQIVDAARKGVPIQANQASSADAGMAETPPAPASATSMTGAGVPAMA